MKKIVVALLGLGLAACASQPSVSENQCRAGDWSTIGFRDGSQGIDQTRLLSHQEACGEFGIVPERAAYIEGWQQGIGGYCTAEKGYSLGRRGASLSTACRGDLSEPFASAHADGRRLYVAERRVRDLENSVDYHYARLEQIDKEMIEVNAAQLRPDLDAETRVLLVADFKALLDERDRLEHELPDLLAELDDAKADFQAEDRTLISRSSN